MRGAVTDHVRSLFRAHSELAEHLPEEALTLKMPVPSDTIGQQFSCLVGGRESHAQAIRAGEWVGFESSLAHSSTGEKDVVLSALERSAEVFEEAVRAVTWDDPRDVLLLDLLDHEAQHQGQLIRYVYALSYRFPSSWADRWALNA